MSIHDPRRRLPAWSHSVAAMRTAKAEVRFAYPTCRQVFDVDLALVERVRGRGFSLVEEWARCKVSRCGGRGFFIAASGRQSPFLPMLGQAWRHVWTVGPRPCDFEPPELPGPTPPGGQRARPWHEAYGDTPLRLVG